MSAGPARLALLVGVLILAGCSGRQLYQSGESWREDQCERAHSRTDPERARCLEEARMDFEEYRRRRDEQRGD